MFPHFISHPCLMIISVVLLMVGYNNSVDQKWKTGTNTLYSLFAQIKYLELVCELLYSERIN